MFQTATQDLYVKRGETWKTTFQFSIDLTGWKNVINIDNDNIILSEGNGITTTPGPNSSFLAVINSQITKQFTRDLHWYMQLTDPSGNVGFPMSGTLHVSAP